MLAVNLSSEKKYHSLIQINRKSIVMIPPIPIPTKPKLPVHIAHFLAETSRLPLPEDLDTSLVGRGSLVQVLQAGGRGQPA